MAGKGHAEEKCGKVQRYDKNPMSFLELRTKCLWHFVLILKNVKSFRNHFLPDIADGISGWTV